MGVVLLVRHGQASFGADDYDVLSDTGWEQSRLLGRYLAERGVTPDVVLRGDMRRHRETGEGMLAGAAWACPAEADPGWDEFDHVGVVAAYLKAAGADLPAGQMDRREFQRVFEQATARWTSGEHDADYAEPFAAFRARVAGALRRACDRAGSGSTVVVVSSGGPVATACGELVAPGAPADLAWQLWGRFNTVVVNTSVSRVVVGATGARLLTFNEHAHLEGEHLTYR
ncbi:histidine phosphatase family protein [Nocardioides sp. GCM10027113]|uniref:histidine phosphatase family protein n=1 Tax=unclassified Nocardioides TaxID=2615069 RepID=UPI0036092ECF